MNAIVTDVLWKTYMAIYTRKITTVLLATISILLMAAFFRFGESHTYHTHELYHYSIGGKYFDKLGYRNIYAASALALVEQGLASKELTIRSLTDKKSFLAYNDWLADASGVKASMGPDLWREFGKDIAFFDKIIKKDHAGNIEENEGWESIFIDHGFNPSPVWVILATPLLNLAPLPAIYPYLVWPDLVLLTASLLLLLLTVDKTSRLVLMIAFWLAMDMFWGSNLHIYDWTGGSLLRYSWFFFLTLGLTQLLRKRYTTSGFFLALAGLERLFPFAFVGAAGIVLVAQLFTRHRVPWKELPVWRFSVGIIGATAMVLLLAALLYPAKYFTEFQQNMTVHEGLYAPNSFGYKKILSYSDDMERNTHWHVIGEEDEVRGFSKSYKASWELVAQRRYEHNLFGRSMKWLLWGLSIVSAVCLMSPIVAVSYIGFSTIFLFAMAANYYYVFLAVYMAATVIAYVSNNKRETGDLWNLFYQGSIILMIMGTVNASDTPVFQSSFVSWLLLLMLLLSPTAYFVGWPRRFVGVLIGLLLAAALWLHTMRYVDPAEHSLSDVNVLFEINGQQISDQQPGFPPVVTSLVDIHGKRIKELGVVIPESSKLQFNVNLPTYSGGPVYLQMRSDFVYPVTASIAINGHDDKVTFERPEMAGFFDYARIKLPENAFVSGENQVSLSLDNGSALAIYHIWLYQEQSI